MTLETNVKVEPPLEQEWHTLRVEEVFKRLGAQEEGLTSETAAQRLAQFGPNELQATAHVSPWKLLLAQFNNVLIIILLIAVALSAFLGEGVDAIAIAIIVIFAVVLGFVQEYRAERAIEALREMAAPTAAVLRNGEEEEIAAREVVPGDVVILRAGDKIPADARLIESINLQVEEAALTGESLPIEKHTDPIAGTNGSLAVGDRKNMVY
ncbi:MAG TPA: HAD-IC family P-type ATPase, partial [Anaerolineales bacterium]|nr:HAD-IC family P-type ATPase [Anaerolineales bacterium]